MAWAWQNPFTARTALPPDVAPPKPIEGLPPGIPTPKPEIPSPVTNPIEAARRFFESTRPRDVPADFLHGDKEKGGPQPKPAPLPVERAKAFFDGRKNPAKQTVKHPEKPNADDETPLHAPLDAKPLPETLKAGSVATLYYQSPGNVVDVEGLKEELEAELQKTPGLDVLSIDVSGPGNRDLYVKVRVK